MSDKHEHDTHDASSSQYGRSPYQGELNTDLGKPPTPHETLSATNSFEDIQAKASTELQSDGRIEISIDGSTSAELPPSYGKNIEEFGVDEHNFMHAPPLSINIMIVGSRGDVQPYLALGQRLRRYGHTVRLTTHEMFRKSVVNAGLRFFNIGGDPHELMSYMVRNPGLIPGFESLKNGDIGKKQKMIAEMLENCWRSCFEPDDESQGAFSFAVDAIISNPPTFAHIHCAEALGVPLLMSFTMPWCPTTAFPHPLVNIKHSSTEPNLTNYLTYGLVDIMTWQGLGDEINKFRTNRLSLPSLSMSSGSGIIERCAVPWTYCMSPVLVPKPRDWMNHIDIVGFYFLDLATSYTPPPELQAFLDAGEPPLYIGFGSIVLDNPANMTREVLGAIKKSGVRALVSTGWGGLDVKIVQDSIAEGASIMVLGNVPHDWLFQRVSAVCHHGGAGTAAIGLRCGKPTIVVPFFGDQPWWAAQIAARGAGPGPLPHKKVTSDTLAEAIRFALLPQILNAAKGMGALIRSEDGVKSGVDSFHRHMPLLNMRQVSRKTGALCEIDPRRTEVWYSSKRRLRLSAFAACVLYQHKEIDISELELHRAREYDTQCQATDVLSGMTLPLLHTVGDFGSGMVQLASKRPHQGLAKMVIAMPNGLRRTLNGMHQGLKNTPKLYGSQTREEGKVTGIVSGMKEGSKGLALGFYDGFTDFVKEPAKGYNQHGVLGGMGGAAKGSLNLMVKPVAGMAGLFSHPVEGAIKSTRSLFSKQRSGRHGVRYEEGLLAIEASTKEE